LAALPDSLEAWVEAFLDAEKGPVYARAKRSALMVASVPELTMRTISTDGIRSDTSLAILVSSSVGTRSWFLFPPFP
jgi:hypothetical protein